MSVGGLALKFCDELCVRRRGAHGACSAAYMRGNKMNRAIESDRDEIVNCGHSSRVHKRHV